MSKTGKGGRARTARRPMPPGREATVKKRPVPVELAPVGAGRVVVGLSVGVTVVFAVASVAAAIAPGSLDAPALILALLMFFGGTAAFAWAYVVALGRSRTVSIGIPGLFGLSGSARPEVRQRLLGSLAAEVVTAVGTAAWRPNTSLAFGILAPMWALGLGGLWAARHGAFPPRPPDQRRLRASGQR